MMHTGALPVGGPRHRWRICTFASLAVTLSACGSPAEPSGSGSVTLTVTVSQELADLGALPVDEYRATIDGPTPRTINAAPGTTETITGLTAGTYTVTVEGLQAGLVTVFDEQGGVVVSAGQNTQVTLALTSFQPTLDQLPPLTAATDVTITFAPVRGAQSYNVEWDTDAGFPSPTSLSTSNTSATITFPGIGTFFVRIQAVDGLGSAGTFSSTGTVDVIDIGNAFATIRTAVLDPFVNAIVNAVDGATGASLGTELTAAVTAIDASDIAGTRQALTAARGVIDGSTVPADLEMLAVLGLVVDFSLSVLP